jgi:signal transduction histidine kinase
MPDALSSSDHDRGGRVQAGLAAAIAVALAAAGAGAADGWDPAFAVVAYLGPVAVITVVAVLLVADRVAGLQRQLVLAGAVTAAGVAMFVKAMYVSRHDALFTVLLAGYGLVIGGWSAWLLGRRALRQLAEAVRARRDVVAAVSHDLRTPITALRLLAEAVDDEIVDAKTRHVYLARMTTNVRALSAMIDDLFELSRLEAGDIRFSMQRVRLEALLAEAVGALRPQAEAGGVAVRAEVDPGMQPARADPEQLQRVLFNLIENAIHHTAPDGSVIVRAQPGQRHVQIEVADTGIGIPDEARERVFDAFFRGGVHAARGEGGAGLGLAIAREIVEAHGGRIWIADSGPGTRVRFSLPAPIRATVAAVGAGEVSARSESRGCRGSAGAPGRCARVRLPGGSGRRRGGA